MRTATNATWAALEGTIMDDLHEKFKELRHDIDEALFGGHERQWHDVFEDVLNSSHGLGNEAVVLALNRMSNKNIDF